MLITSGAVPFSHGLTLISKRFVRTNAPLRGGLACGPVRVTLLSQDGPRKRNPW